jgi:hypothetical protein
MSNNIIKSFDISPSSGDIVSDSDNLYFNITVNKNNLLNKNSRFIKICVVKNSDLLNLNSTQEGYSSSYLNKIFNNDYLKIKQYEYEDNPISTNNDESVYEELTFGVSLNTIKSVIGVIKRDPSTGESTNSEIPHTIKIYFLDKNKNIIENYSYTQNSNVKLEDYKVVDFQDEIFNLLRNTLDIDFRNYDITTDLKSVYQKGPKIIYSDLLNDIDSFDKSKINVSINFNNNIYDFSSSSLPKKLIENYKFDLLFDLYNYFLSSEGDEVNLDLNFSYNENEFLKTKTISKSRVIGLYETYFDKFKDRFISEAFHDKIKVLTLDGELINPKTKTSDFLIENFRSLSISFSNPDLSFIPTSFTKKGITIEIINQGTIKNINKLYTTSNFNEDNIITTSKNNEFNFDTLFNQDLDSTLYARGGLVNTETEFIIKLDKLQIYPVEILTSEEIVRQDDSFSEELDFSRMFDKLIDFNNFISSANQLKFKLNQKLVYNTKTNLSNFGYNVDSNDYLFEEISKNSVIEIKKNYTNLKNEKIEEITYEAVSNLISEDENGNIFINLNSNYSPEEANASISCRSMTLPNNSLSKLGKLNKIDDEDEKEKVSSFLNKSFPGKFSKINKLVSKDLYNNDSSDRQIYKKIIDISESKNLSSFSLNRNNINRQIPNVKLDEELLSRKILSESNIFNYRKQLFNLSLENDKNNLNYISYLRYKKQSNFIKIFKKKKDFVIASLNLEDFFKEKNYTNLSFNISMLLTLEFDSSKIKLDKINNNKSYKNKILLDEGFSIVLDNLYYNYKDNILTIICPFEEKFSRISDDDFDKAINLWGENNSLYFMNVFERLCIIINNNKKVVSTININNYVKKDYSLENNFSNKTYLLDNNTRISDIVFSLK